MIQLYLQTCGNRMKHTVDLNNTPMPVRKQHSLRIKLHFTELYNVPVYMRGGDIILAAEPVEAVLLEVSATI